MKLHSTITALAVAAFCIAAMPAFAERSSLPPITKSFTIEGVSTSVTIHPDFAVSGSNGVVAVDLRARVDASDLQRDLKALLDRRWKFEDCGDRFTTGNPDIRPAGNGGLHIGLTAQAQKWQCVKTKLPKTYFENKCVVHAFGKCRFSTKVPVIHMKMETAKTKLISQSIRLEALASTAISGDAISAEIRVTKALPSGLAGQLVKAFGLHDKIKGLVQTKLREKLREHRFVLPEEIKAYDVEILQADFVDLGGGRLGLDVRAQGRITQAQIAALLANELAKAN
ncbi:MAG: hypothetical protein KJ834_01625 [Alphaproteobacteria bacterium]|nr:hypothetical protein [Alphaproteobacteria bacterium]